MQKQLYPPTSEPRKVYFGKLAQSYLSACKCPFCDTHLDYGHTFQQEDGRQGGLMECDRCNIRFAWIDSPFECEIQEIQKPHVNSILTGQAYIQKQQHPPTDQQEIIITNEQIRVKFPALYDWATYSKTDPKEIIRQSKERESLILQGSRSTPNSPTLERR